MFWCERKYSSATFIMEVAVTFGALIAVISLLEIPRFWNTLE
jgi:lipopolysaccharide/colanic/teichoic acid biosynthesis glycosyltransferase